MTISKLEPAPLALSLKPAPARDDVQKKESNPVADPKEQAKLQKACQDFEAILLNYTLSKMRETVPKSDLMGSDHGEEIYRGMLDEQLTQQMASHGGVGLSAVLFQQLTAHARHASPSPHDALTSGPKAPLTPGPSPAGGEGSPKPTGTGGVPLPRPSSGEGGARGG